MELRETFEMPGNFIENTKMASEDDSEDSSTCENQIEEEIKLSGDEQEKMGEF